MSYFWDAFAIVAYFVLVIGVGLASSRHRGDNMREFSVGSRQLPWWAVLASIVAAELSAATFLGTPAEGYHGRNFLYAQLAIGTVIARVIVAYLFIRPFYDNNVVSIYEFLQIRFGVATRNAASAVFLITRLLASGTRLYVAAVIVVVGYEMIHGVAATNEQAVWIYGGAVLLVTALTTVYTAAGGIRAVVWTDVIQATVMGGAVIYALVSLWFGVGGWAGVHGVLNQPGDLQIFSSGFDLASTTPSGTLDVAHGHPILGAISGILGNEYTIWAALLGSVFTTMATHGTDQDMVQRMLTAKDHHKARLALVLSGLVDIPVAMGFLFIGILIYVFYQLHPDPNLPVKNPEIFSYYILHQLPSGARGLLIAGVLATAMGSLSTALNALATSFTQDFWVPWWGRGADEHRVVRAVRWSTVVFALLLAAVGTITAAVVVYSPHARIIPVVLGIFGYTYGSLLGIFLLGLTTKDRGTEPGNLIAMAAGFVAVSIWSGLPWDLMTAVSGRSCSPPVWLVQIEFPWRVMFGTLTTYAVAWCFKVRRS
ncbi:MAG TPA: sodium:solute symporter [Candidatus Methylacidiphilales bacterium]|jgi:SSS family transporter|nr:sodium:solute symporter [Candidatus Methylacidiphilales bacterium]